MPFTAYLLALIALLATPGPTNTLLALAGARQGRGATHLLPAELTGYLLAVLPLSLARIWFDPAAGGLGMLLQIGAAIWVACLALRLGMRPAQGDYPDQKITPRQILITTLLNPKVLILALVLMPPPGNAAYLPHLAGFIFLVPALGYTWVRLGALLQATAHPRCAGWFQRLAALWLATLALALAHRALTG